MTKLHLLDLFSGIGGFSLGLERSGYFETVAFCEIEAFPRAVLQKHWPKVPCYHDIRELTGERLVRDGITVDAICGGFPCQDISFAGLGAGIAGARSGLWSEYARLIREIRPRYVIVENVSAILSRGLGTVLADLAAIGYDAEWNCVPASAVGAPHRRDRLWLVAYPNDRGHRIDNGLGKDTGATGIGEGEGHQREWLRTVSWRSVEAVPNAAHDRTGRRIELTQGGEGARDVADTEGERRGETRQYRQRQAQRAARCGEALADTNKPRLEGWGIDRLGTRQWSVGTDRRSVPGEWLAEPDVGRVANGVPARMDRLKGLGNAVIPQIPEIIGRAIGEYEARR